MNFVPWDQVTFGGIPIKDVLIDALCGAGFGGSMDFADRMTKLGLARSTGNQWNEEWKWDHDALRKKGEEELLNIYAIVKKQ